MSNYSSGSYTVQYRAVDPHSFCTDPDPAVFLIADLDPGGKMNADPDPGGKINADPDPQPWFSATSMFRYSHHTLDYSNSQHITK